MTGFRVFRIFRIFRVFRDCRGSGCNESVPALGARWVGPTR